MYICMYTYHNIIWKESQILKHEQHFFFLNMKQFCHNHKDSHWRNESDEYSRKR